MKEFNDKKKVMIPCRFSFLHCWEPDSVNGSEPKYSISAIIHAIWAQVKTSIDRLFSRL